ncbi:DUF3224 domain-containing protein [Streptomyces sp. NPDC021354]|uniref:DUF3224 domain-containing protein n=1 Tax=Streptomyces sp. NPDC021354 TaxID=3154793 RepID=UPI0033FE4996
MTTHATGTFAFANWDENTVGEAGDGTKLARATVTNSYSGTLEAERTTCEYAITYFTDKTGVCTGYELVTGTLDGRTGSFVLVQHGTFGEDGKIHCSLEVVPGSGTGELAGLTGKGGFVAMTGQSTTPYSFEYDLG